MPTPPQQPPGNRPHAPGRPPCPPPAIPGRDSGEPRCPCPPGGSRPLPDPAAVRLYRVPESAPPYDAPAVADAGSGYLAGGPGQADPAPASGQNQSGQDQDSKDQDSKDESGQARPADGRGGASRPGRAGPAGGAGADGWPGQFAQVLAETLAGSRPPRQIVPWTTERARTHIRRLGAQLSAGQQPRVRRVVTCRPRQDVVEMTVIVGFGSRVRALAVRLERTEAAQAGPGRPARAARWLCTAVEAA